MSNLTFLNENYVKDATLSVLSGSVDANFPVENIKDVRTTKVFRSDSNTVELQIDLLVTQSIDAFAVVGSSVDGLGFTSLTIYGSGSTDFSGSTPITIDLNSENNIGFKFFDEVPFRFWKLEFTGTGSYTEVSKIFLGRRRDFIPNSFSLPSFRYTNQDTSRVRTNSYGQPFIDRRTRLKRIEGTIQHMNNEEFDSVNEMMNINGTTEPIWVFSDPQGLSATNGEFLFSFYGRLLNVRQVSYSGFGLFNVSMTLEQIG